MKTKNKVVHNKDNECSFLKQFCDMF